VGRAERQRIRNRRFVAILWVLLIGNLAAALLYSPLTAIRRVRVVGAPYWDEARLGSILASVQGVPCAQVKAASIESAALAIPDVKSAEFDRNLFGSAVLTLTYRRPAASVAGRPGVALFRDGSVFRSEASLDGLPAVRFDGTELDPNLTLARNWPAEEIARLAKRVKELPRAQEASIELGKDGSVCLNIGAGQVVLGSCDDMDAKLATLQRILDKDPGILARVKSLNLVVASAPSVVPVSPGGGR
jgi:cell division septal protein FtsQ